MEQYLKITTDDLKEVISRKPLYLNKLWNLKVSACKNNHELMLLVLIEATVSEKDYLISSILSANSQPNV